MLLMPGEVLGTPLAPAPSHRTDEPIVYWLLYQKRSTSGCVGRETELLDAVASGGVSGRWGSRLQSYNSQQLQWLELEFPAGMTGAPLGNAHPLPESKRLVAAESWR